MNTPTKKRAKKKYRIRSKAVYVPTIMNVSQTGRRIKVNFMMDVQLMKAFNEYVPNGGKSNFLNQALEEALKDAARRKASDAMDELREREKMHMSTKEFIRLKNYGRE